MRVRFVLFNAYLGGGTVRTTFLLAGELTRRGHDVEVASVYRHLADPQIQLPPGVRLRPLMPFAAADGPPRGARARLARVLLGLLRRVPSVLSTRHDARYPQYSLAGDLMLWRYLRTQSDSVVVGTRCGINLALARSAPTGVTLVLQEHLHLGRAGPSLRRLYRRWYPRAAVVTTLTRGDAERYRELLGPRVPVLALPNPAVAPTGSRGDGRLSVVVAAGRLNRQKGFDLLIRAWVRVHRAHPTWTLHIYGEGPRRPRLAKMIENRGLASSVRLEGFTPDLQERLAEAGVFVLSSRFEGFPMVLIEAMSAGTPVVTYDCPTGPAELVTDDVDGLLVQPESVPGLAEALSRLLADPAQRQRLGVAGQARVAELALDRVGARWEQVLAGLPGGAHSPGGVVEGAASQPEAPNCSTLIASTPMPDSPSSRWAYDENPTEPHT